MLSEIKGRKKKLVKDPIKSIGLGGGNTAKEIVTQIASALGLKVHSDGIGVSAYGGTTIRISDHRTYMQTWVDSGAWQSPYRFDIVIEDEETVAQTQVKNGYDFTITEYISKSSEMTPQIARMIAYDIRNTITTGNGYANNVRAFKTTLISTHGIDGSSDNTNNDIKTENYMRNNKRTIRLTETDLHRVIRESVKRVLREGFEGTDEIDEAVTNAASVIADAYFSQNGLHNVRNDDVDDDSDDSWYELQESLRDAMLNAATEVLNSAF